MIRSFAPLILIGAMAALAACERTETPAEDAAAGAEAIDPVITEPDLTLPPEEAETPPPTGSTGAAAPQPTPTLPPEEGAAPSPADSPPQPDA